VPRKGLVSVPCVKILDAGLPLSVSGDNESMRKLHEIERSGPSVAVVSVAPGSQLELAGGDWENINSSDASRSEITVEYSDEELDWELDAEEHEQPMRPSRSPQTRTSGSMGSDPPPSAGNVVPEAPRGLDFERWAFGPENGIGSLRPLAPVSDDEQQPTLAERRPSTQDHTVQIELGTPDVSVRHAVRDPTVSSRILPTARVEVEPAARPLVQAVGEAAAEPLVQVVAQREAQRSQAQAAVRRSDSQRVVEREAQLEAQLAEYRCVPAAEPLPVAQPRVPPDAPLEAQSEVRAEERPDEVQPVRLPTLRQRTDGSTQQAASPFRADMERLVGQLEATWKEAAQIGDLLASVLAEARLSDKADNADASREPPSRAGSKVQGRRQSAQSCWAALENRFSGFWRRASGQQGGVPNHDGSQAGILANSDSNPRRPQGVSSAGLRVRSDFLVVWM